MAPVSFCEPPPSQIRQEKSTVGDGNTPLQNAPSEQNGATTTPRLPVVALDVDILTDTVAARLATSLLGHVLFLKNQIPLPIVQLARMTNKQSNDKSAKLKADLLSAFDTLTSHFVTTFSALSTALARMKTSDSGAASSRVFLAIVVGPSPGAAKSKVIYGVDKFQTRVWGLLDEPSQNEGEEANGSGDECPEDSEDEKDDEEANSEESDAESAEDEEDSEDREDDEDSEANSDDSDDDEGKESKQENAAPSNAFPSLSPYQSYAEEQRFLQAADRLLARALASADANGRGIANEMSPSQSYILIRAPRRFSHPAWIPRQNLTKQMDNALTDFLDETWSSPNTSSGSARKKKPVEGVWVTGRGGLGDATHSPEPTPAQEEDEMIWWSWDGKLTGFADW
ncbi:hypothetical protein D9756_001045 [Leucocoprinus leucothites]|uniref:Uncharacterized protein n=1 Tax=Leucocoprinus leucothites TaxID=201217 RepID=A0A8H5LNT3_9AGAR|nr:hypothetical protein D9756_001045 [Leucoagaricus leucothites]